VSELTIAQLRGAAALAGRETRRVLYLWTQTILPAIVTALLFLAVFGGALGQRIREIEGIPYLDFILPGLLVMTMASQSFANNSTSLFQAKNEGYIEDVLSSPLRGWQLALAYMTGGLVRGAVAVIVVAAAASPFVAGFHNAGLLAAALVITGLTFAALGVITGVWADSFDQHSFIANLVIAPLALVGGVFYSAATLSQPWQTLTRLNPIYYLVDAARAGTTGFEESSVTIAILVAAAVAIAVFATAAKLLAIGWRLKP
jgi:ABC-2 type transport system permease protein